MTIEPRGITRRALLRLAVAAPVVPGLVALPTIRTAALPRLVRPRVRRLQLDARQMRRVDADEHQREMPGRRPSGEVYASAAEETEPFTVTALTWTGGNNPSDVALLIRTRQRGGDQWSQWIELHDDGHGPDPGTPEAHTSRHGTDVVIAGDSDAVEVRVESPGGDLPDDLRVELIDPGESPADATAAVQQGGVTEAAVTAKPTIRTRADWGADESMRGDPEYAEVRGMFVHHTAGSNSYSASDVPGTIRSIYAYHIEGRGWRDIGYNFLIDKFGGIWEGRYGGVDRAVIGAHTLGYNTYAFAASVLGTYTSKEPESAVLQAYQRLIAWKFSIHGVNPDSNVSYPGQQTLPAISGHRDAGATECPGQRLYNQLGTIRSGVANRQGVRYFLPRQRIGASTSWNLYTAFVGIGDFTGNGHQDMIARGESGALYLFPGRSNGTFGSRQRIGASTSWNNYTALVGMGDFTGNGHQDMIARATNGALYLFPGRSNGTFGTRQQIGASTSWNNYTALVGMGDFTGNGHYDMIARATNGTLHVFPSLGNGTFGTRQQIGASTTWNNYNALVGGPGRNVVARGASGALYLFAGRGNGAFGARQRIGASTTWNNYTALVGMGDFTGNGYNDMIARGEGGALYLFPGRAYS